MKIKLSSIKSYALVFTILTLIYIIYNNFQSNQPASIKDNFLESEQVSLKDVSNFSKKIKDTSNKNLPERKIVGFGYGLRLFDWDGNFIDSDNLTTSSNNEIKIIVSMVNATETTDHVGFYIFVDGLLQKFSVDGGPANYLYSTDLSGSSVINVPLISKLEGISNKEKHQLFVVMLYNMSELPGEKYKFIDFYTNSLSKQVQFTSNQHLQSRVVEDATQEIPALEKDKVNYNSVRVVISKEDEKNIFSQQSIQIKTNEVSNTKFILRGFGKKGLYSTVIFLNHNPIMVDGKAEIFWRQEQGFMFEKQLTINLPERIESFQMYSITVPLDSQIPFAIGSQKFMVELF